MPKLLLAALSLIGILTLAAVLTPSGRADPALTRSNSVLPPQTLVRFRLLLAVFIFSLIS